MIRRLADSSRMAWRVVAVTSMAMAGVALAQPNGQPGLAPPGQPPAAPARAPYGPDPRVTTGTLDNGLSYLLMPLTATSTGTERGAAVRLIVEAGLVHENEGQYGTADVAAEAARLRAGAGATASVEPEQAVIGFDLAAGADSATLAGRLSQLAGMASGSPLAGDAVNAARTAAADRLAHRSPEQRVHDQATRRLMPGSRAVRRPAAGLADSVRAIAPDAVNEFLRRWYVASNMTVVVAGPGSADDLRALVQNAFGALPRVPKPASPAPAATAWTPPAGPIVIEDPDLSTVMVSVVSARPGRSNASVRDFRTSVVQEAGIRLLSSLVSTRITKHKVPFSSAVATRINGSEGLSWTAFNVTGDPSAWRDVVTNAVSEVNRLLVHGMDRIEVRETLIAMAAAWEAEEVAEADAGAGALADMLVQSRGGPSKAQRVDLLVAIVGSISADDAEWEFNKRFDRSASAVVVALPSRPGNPAEAEVRQIVSQAWSAQPEPASELIRPWKVMPQLPAGGEIAEMTQDAASGVWSGWLSNGIRFHFRQMAGREPGGVEVGLTIAGGELLEDPTTRGLTDVVCLSWNGLTTDEWAQDTLYNLYAPSGARMQAAAQPDQIRVNVQTDRSWFNPFMQRLNIMLTSSIVSQRNIEQYVANLQERLDVVGSDPNETFTKLLADAQYVQGEVRVRPPTVAMAQALTVDAARAWRDRMAACPMEIAIVGDIEPADALEALRFYLGGLPDRPRIGTATFAERRGHVTNPLPHEARKILDVRGSTTSLIMHGFYVCPSTERADAMALLAAASALNNRLTTNAPTLGLPGGGFVAVNFSPSYPDTSFLFYGVQAQAIDEMGVDHVVETVTAQFAKFAAEGPTDDELQPVLEQLATEAEQGMDVPTAWWDHLCTTTYRGVSVADLTDRPTTYRAMTRAQVREAFARYLARANNRLDVSVLPPPADGLINFIDNPPPPPEIEEPVLPAGPPAGDPANPGQ